MNCKIWWEGVIFAKFGGGRGVRFATNGGGGGSDLQLTLAKYAWVGIRFAIYPSEKHLELVSTDFENFWRFDF